MNVTFNYDKDLFGTIQLSSNQQKTLSAVYPLPKPTSDMPAPLTKIKMSIRASNYITCCIDKMEFLNSSNLVVGTVNTPSVIASNSYQYQDYVVPSNAYSIKAYITVKSTYYSSISNAATVCLFEINTNNDIAPYYIYKPTQMLSASATSVYPGNSLISLTGAGNTTTYINKYIDAPTGYCFPSGAKTIKRRLSDASSHDTTLYIEYRDINNNLLGKQNITKAASTTYSNMSITVPENTTRLCFGGSLSVATMLPLTYYIDLSEYAIFNRPSNGYYVNRVLPEGTISLAGLTIKINGGITDYVYSVFEDTQTPYYPTKKETFDTKTGIYKNIYIEPTTSLAASTPLTDLWIYKAPVVNIPTNIVLDSKRSICNTTVINNDTSKVSNKSQITLLDTFREVTNKITINKLLDTLRNSITNIISNSFTKRSISNSTYSTHDLKRNSVLDELTELDINRETHKEALNSIDTQRNNIYDSNLIADTQREAGTEYNIVNDTYRKRVTDDMLYRDAIISSYAEIGAAKYNSNYYIETPITQIAPMNNKVRKVTLQVYRRENNIWIEGNKPNVKLSYKLYDNNKNLITPTYVEVPAGTFNESIQYVIVDINVPNNAKFINFEMSLNNVISSDKEHRIKVEVVSVNIYNTNIPLIINNPTIKHAYTELEPYWITRYTLKNTYPKGTVIVDKDNISMKVALSTTTDYSDMQPTNKLDYTLATSDSYSAFVRSEDTTYPELAYIDEGITKLPIIIKCDTKRDSYTDLIKRWIPVNIGSPIINETAVYTNGIYEIKEKIVTYDFAPSNTILHTTKLEIEPLRIVGSSYMQSNVENSENDYIRLSYSFDGTNYIPLVNTSMNKAILDIPPFTKTLFFKYSVRRPTNMDKITIFVKLLKQEIQHKDLQFYGVITKDMIKSADAVMFPNSVWWTEYTTTIEHYNSVGVSDLYLHLPECLSQDIQIWLYDKVTGVAYKSFGKQAVYNPNIHSEKITIYVKGDTIPFPPQSIYMTTIANKTINKVLDTWRKASGKTLAFIFDSKRKISESKNIIVDSNREKVVNNIGRSDSLRNIIKNNSSNSDVNRLIANKVSKDFDLTKLSSVDSNLDIDSTRYVTKSNISMSDLKRHSRSISIKSLETKRKAAKSITGAHDTKKTTTVTDIINAITQRKAIKTQVNKQDLLRKTYSIMKTTSDSKRRSIKSAKVNSDTNRRSSIVDMISTLTQRILIRTEKLAADTMRRVRTTENVIISEDIDVTRVVIKNTNIKSDTKRFMGFPYKVVVDTLKSIIYKAVLKYDTKKTANKDSNKYLDTQKKAIKNHNNASDTQRSVYWHLYTNMAADLQRKTANTSKIYNDTHKHVIKSDYVIADTLREGYFKKDIDLNIDTSRISAINQSFITDTDRLPFYFINMNADAKRKQIYQGKTFLYDTTRDKYATNMTRVHYDTIRAIKVIKNDAKMYNYNIKICNSLEFDIKM